MKKYLNVLFFLLLSIPAFSQTKTYKIGFLLDKSNAEIDAQLSLLEEEIISVVGEDAAIVFPDNGRLVNHFDPTVALGNYNQLVNSKFDIIISFGSVNNKVLVEKQDYPVPTIIFGFLSKEVVADKSLLDFKKVENFTAIATLHSYEEDLTYLKQLVSPKRVAVFVEQAFFDAIPLEGVFASIGQTLDMELVLVPFVTLDDIMDQVEGFDAVYMVGGYYFSDDEIKTLARFLIDRKLPSFTTTPVVDVENGLLATNHDKSEIEQFFRRVALNVESVVLGDEFSEPSSFLVLKRGLTLNYNTARALGIPLKYSYLTNTSFVGNLTEISADKKYSLLEVMQEAIAENLKLKTVVQDTLLSAEDVKLAKSNYLPNVTASASGVYVDPNLAEVANGQNPELSTFGNITLSQTVFSEAANANISIQKALREAQKENYNSEELNTVFNAASLYFNALILKSNYLIQYKNLELTKSNLKIATHNYEAGQAGKSDVLRFTSEMVQNTQAMVEALNAFQQALNALNEVLNNPMDAKIDVDETELESNIFENYNYKQLETLLDDPSLRAPLVKFLVQEAIANAPELKVLDYNLQAANRSERLYGSGRFLPTVALQGQYNYTFSRSGAGSTFPSYLTAPPDGYYNVGLNVSIPIFDSNRQNINKQIASIQSDQLNTSRDNLKLTIQKNVNDAVLQMVNQISNIEISKVFEETAKEALDLTQTSYANGAVNIVQLLDAQNNYLQAQLARSNATYNYLLSAMALERYLGNFFLLQTPEERQEFITRFLEFSNKN